MSAPGSLPKAGAREKVSAGRGPGLPVHGGCVGEVRSSDARHDASAWPTSLQFESRYRVLRSLSDGGMGEVVLAEHLTLGKRVAIKMIRPQHAGDAETEERFILETRAAGRIHHENVVGISDFGRTVDGRMFFVMEYVEGEDLAQTLRNEGPLPWKRVVQIARQVCRGIGEAHRQGVIHRDIKPGNCIRVTREGDPDFIKVVDFGLAKLFDARDQYRGPTTIAGVVLGTPGYRAPEVEAGHRPDARVDLYAIGVLMIRLLTGKLPDEGGVRALAQMFELPPSLVKLLHKALREDPDARFQTAQAMEGALEYVIQATARPPSLQGVKLGTRLPTGHAMQAPRRAESGPMQVGPRAGTGPLPAAARSMQGPVALAGRSRSWVALVSLAMGLLAGSVVALWMHMSRGTDDGNAARREAEAREGEPRGD